MPSFPQLWPLIMRLLAVLVVVAVVVGLIRGEPEGQSPVAVPAEGASPGEEGEADPPESVVTPEGEFVGNVFDRPQTQGGYQRLQLGIAQAFRLGNIEGARQMLEKALQLSPEDPGDHYNLACALARLGENEAALVALEKAVEWGFHDADHLLADNDLASLREQEAFAKIADRARELGAEEGDQSADWESRVTPTPVKDGIAWVTGENTVWDYRSGLFRTFFTFPETPEETKVATGWTGPRRWLRSWYGKGTAAGNHGDLYDNHDGDHSNLAYQQFPQLTRVEYGEAPRARKLSMGLQLKFLHNHVTIGNSSTAQVQSVFWRSQPRAAYVTPGGAARLHLQYTSNHLYFYPEHRDHDPGHNGEGPGEGGYGDVFPANTPYVILSQGSSGSDRPFLEAIAATLAAFHPEVKKSLADSGDLMPAVQMLFRSSRKPVRDREDYFTGVAHPTVFDAESLDVGRLVKMAHAIEADALPPRVQIRVTEEDRVALYGGERLFDTPDAIARVFRAPGKSRRMVVSAEASRDPQGEPLTYHWKVLRGNEEAIQIRTLNEEGSLAEIVVGYHERAPIAPGAEIESNRVDIGVFVSNEHHVSAPAFLSTYFLDNEKRVYDEEGNLLSIDFADPERKDNYVDPMVDARKDWRDEFVYDESGELRGWKRTREGQDKPEEFTAEGFVVAARGANGEVTGVREVAYVIRQDEEGREPSRLETVVSGTVKAYGKASSQEAAKTE